MLLFSVLESTSYESNVEVVSREDDHPLLRSLIQISDELDSLSPLESLNDANYYRDELRANFRRGRLFFLCLPGPNKHIKEFLGKFG